MATIRLRPESLKRWCLMFDLKSRFKKPVLLLALILAPGLALPQDKKSDKTVPKDEKSPFTFKVPVDVIVVNVTVTDKKKMPVLDLTVDDFKVYEDGKPQPIHTFTLESYKTTQTLPAAGRKPEVAIPTVTEDTSASASQPRMFSLVIDDVTTSQEYFPQVYQAMRKFVEEDLAEGDLVSIVSGSGSVQHSFTSDRQLLHVEIDELYKRLSPRQASKSTCPQLTDLQALRIVNDVRDGVSLPTAVMETCYCAHLPLCDTTAELMARSQASAQFHESQYRNRGLLRSLRQYARSLKHFEAKKILVLFSDGLLSEELIYDLQDVVDQALRSGVVFNAVDVRGLYVPMYDASSSIDVPQEVSIVKGRLLSEDASSQEEPLVMLAHDTGGIFHHNSNDLHAGLKEISEREAHYYVLSYATPSQKSDGRYHKIKLEVSRPGLELAYRRGYYAPKEELSFERKRKEDILEALRAPGNVNEIPVGFSYNSYQVDDSNYELELVTRVDIRRMQFVDEESRRKNLISLVIVALDENDRYIDGLQKDVSFNLTPGSYTELLGRGFSSKVNFRMPPGRYKIKAVIRESVQSKMGSLTKLIEVP